MSTGGTEGEHDHVRRDHVVGKLDDPRKTEQIYCKEAGNGGEHDHVRRDLTVGKLKDPRTKSTK